MLRTGLRYLTIGRPKVPSELRALPGTEIVVPDLHGVANFETVECPSGRITSVREPDDRLIRVIVRLEDGEEIASRSEPDRARPLNPSKSYTLNRSPNITL